MAITIKTKEEINILREGGRRLAKILNEVAKQVVPGVAIKDLNTLAYDLIIQDKDTPSFLHYTPEGNRRPYPSSLCVSVNDEVVHGISTEGDRTLVSGDIVSLDLGLKHEGLFTDMAITVPVGKIDAVSLKLIDTTRQALSLGIEAIRPGSRVGTIGKAIEDFVRPSGFSIVETLSGHGVGYKVHEEPYVPNYIMKSQGPVLKPGMVIAIEPMLNEGSKDVLLDKDGYTYRTKDGKRSAHFEHTVVITESGAEILTI